MVYGGKPSRGCGTCRARRIKCDEGKPTCQRCAKSKRECRGYRHEFDVVHRDQTNSTLRRVARQEPTLHQHHYQQRHQQRHHVCQPWQQQTSAPQPAPGNALTVPLAQRASCYFASNFILIPLSATPHGFLDYLVPLIASESHGSSLLHAFNACAFALLSNRTKADTINLSQLSLKEHTLALARTHKALSDSATATADATLATVLLLSLYETITARKESRMLAWRSHIDGAVNIVQTRGREMCRTKTGALLFAAVRHQIISRTLSSGIPIPFGADWWMSAGYSNTILATAQRFALKCGELKNSTDHILSTCHRSSEAIERVRKEAEEIRLLDHDIDNWLGSVPDEFRYRTVSCVWEDDPEVFPGRVDVYPDFVTASAWNLARVTRILLAAVYMRLTAWICAPTMDYRDAPEYAVSRLICQRTISDILASVPYHLGWHLSRGDPRLVTSDISGFACGDGDAHLKALPGFFLIWSLTCVKNHDISSPEQRAWVKGRLRIISEQVGLKYAQVVNDVELRFPSMMIQRDGMSRFTDPYYRPVALEAPSRPEIAEAPITPESMSSSKGSPSP